MCKTPCLHVDERKRLVCGLSETRREITLIWPLIAQNRWKRFCEQVSVTSGNHSFFISKIRLVKNGCLEILGTFSTSHISKVKAPRRLLFSSLIVLWWTTKRPSNSMLAAKRVWKKWKFWTLACSCNLYFEARELLFEHLVVHNSTTKPPNNSVLGAFIFEIKLLEISRIQYINISRSARKKLFGGLVVLIWNTQRPSYRIGAQQVSPLTKFAIFHGCSNQGKRAYFDYVVEPFTFTLASCYLGVW